MQEVRRMIATVWLALSGLLYSLQLQTGSFPKPLTASEEQHYLELAAQGDLEARNILIERNLRLVAHIMKKYYAQMSDQEDLISIGTIGLIKGVTTFDQSKGARLATYAARCVENAILSPMRFRAEPRSPAGTQKYLPGIFMGPGCFGAAHPAAPAFGRQDSSATAGTGLPRLRGSGPPAWPAAAGFSRFGESRGSNGQGRLRPQ